MGHRRQKRHHPTTKSAHTLPSSPTHSSDFEFTISGASTRKSSGAAADLCPADEIFYKGQLLPLHISPRLSMVRTLLLSSASTSSSSDTTTTASRDSTDSSSSSSGRPSSVTDDEFKRLTNTSTPIRKPSNNKYFSLPKLSSVFRKEQKNPTPPSSSAVKRVSSTAKEVIRRYLRKVKPIYEKLSQKQQQNKASPPPPFFRSENTNNNILHSFSGNLRSPRGRRRSYISSCPSSMRSSPSHGKTGFGFYQTDRAGSDSSSMEELQNAIQGAISHCKNSMLQNKTMLVSNQI